MSTPAHPGSSNRELLLRHLYAHPVPILKAFMREQSITGLSGTKEELEASIRRALGAGDLQQDALIGYLDRVEPRAKQHVVLYDTPGHLADLWSDEAEVEAAVNAAGLSELWQQRVPLAAPDQLELSSIQFDDGRLEVYAVARRTYLRRRPELEQSERVIDGIPVEEHLFERVVVRQWSRLVWDPTAGAASIHISQLPQERLYSEALEEFLDLLHDWLPFDAFSILNLARVIGALHTQAETGTAEARIQAVEYNTFGGRRIAVRGLDRNQEVLGENAAVDEAVRIARDNGTGAGGNFYFLPAADGSGPPNNPLREEAHVDLVVFHQRVNFRRATGPGGIDYICSRVRALAA